MRITVEMKGDSGSDLRDFMPVIFRGENDEYS
jgi:hypothetical protein